MPDDGAYNPLDKIHLAESVATAILNQPVERMPLSESFSGAGIYAIYYIGNFPAYRAISARNRRKQFSQPIYIGKAIPSGARRGGVGLDVNPGTALFSRLSKHAQSIAEVENLDISDFYCRYLVVDDIWIPLGEALLIHRFTPIWNTTLDGFGNNDPGAGRYNQQRSPWDEIHPGRHWAKRCRNNLRSHSDIMDSLRKACDALK